MSIPNWAHLLSVTAESLTERASSQVSRYGFRGTRMTLTYSLPRRLSREAHRLSRNRPIASRLLSYLNRVVEWCLRARDIADVGVGGLCADRFMVIDIVATMVRHYRTGSRQCLSDGWQRGDTRNAIGRPKEAGKVFRRLGSSTAVTMSVLRPTPSLRCPNGASWRGNGS